MIFGGVHLECARFLSCLSLLHNRRVHGEFSGRTVLGEVHPVGTQNKTLISDTVVSDLSPVSIQIPQTSIPHSVGPVTSQYTDPTHIHTS